MIEGSEHPAGGTPPRAPPPPEAPDRAEAPATGSDKAEPEKAETEIEAGDVADDLADFA